MKTSQVCAMPLKCFEAQERHEQTKDCTYNEESVSQAENKKIYKKYPKMDKKDLRPIA